MKKLIVLTVIILGFITLVCTINNPYLSGLLFFIGMVCIFMYLIKNMDKAPIKNVIDFIDK